MNNSLERLTEGIIATLRTHVIPYVSDDYARGQAIGVIDILNNIGPRLEWARAPILQAVLSRRDVVQSALALAPEAPVSASVLTEAALQRMGSAQLAEERDRLDGEIADLLAWADGAGPRGGAVTALLRQHAHDDLTLEMKKTRKPLFAEIAKGSGASSS